MIIVNYLEKKSFGPIGSSAGFFIFIAGLLISYFNLTGIILAIAGAFAAFTSTSTIIDTDKKRIKHADNIFGFFPAGKWIDVRTDMKLGLQKVKRGYAGYTRANMPLQIKYDDIRICLFDSGNKKIAPLKKFDSLQSAKNGLNEMESLLGVKSMNQGQNFT